MNLKAALAWSFVFASGASLVYLGCTSASIGSSPSMLGAILLVQTDAGAGAVPGPSGTTLTLAISASVDDAAVQGVSIAFAGQTSGVIVKPETAQTNPDGVATTYVFVPYGVAGVVVASTQGSPGAAISVASPQVMLALDAGAVASITPGGESFPLTVIARTANGTVVPGMSVTLTAQPSSITVSPGTVTTNDAGVASAYAAVPYGTHGIAVASAAGAVVGTAPLVDGPVSLSMAATPTVVGTSPTGVTYEVSFHAGAPSSAGTAVEGFAVSFGVQPSSLSVSPASASTDSKGVARAFVAVPFDTQGYVIASGGGAVPKSAPLASGALTITATAGAPTEFNGTGAVVPVSVKVASGTGLPGASVALAAAAPGVVVGPGTLTTDGDGGAQGFVFLPYDSEALAVVSTSASHTYPLPLANPSVELDVKSPRPAGDITLNGQFWQVSANVRAGGQPVAGVSLTMTPLTGGSPTGAAAVTDDAGSAKQEVFVAWGPSELVQVSGGGATEWVTIPAAANPLTLARLCWSDREDGGAGLYEVTTYATATQAGRSVPIPGASVAFSIVNAAAATSPVFQPSVAVTDATGRARSVLALGPVALPQDGGTPRVAIQATSGASTVVAVLPFGSPGRRSCPPP